MATQQNAAALLLAAATNPVRRFRALA